MSNGEKKPGVKDISDLKARLGMLNKGGAARPSIPGAPAAPAGLDVPSGPPVLTEDMDASLGMETQVVRVEPRQMEEPPEPPPEPVRQSPRTIPGPPAVAPPGPIGGGALNLGADLFKKPEPVRQAPPPMQAPAAPVAPPPPEPPSAAERFVNPLAARVPQTALSAEDEAGLSAVEKGQKGVRPAFLIAISVAVGLIFATFGFVFGTGRIQHQLLDMQVKEAATVRDRMVPLIQKMEELANVVEPMNPGKIEWPSVSAMPEDLPGVDAAGILSTKVPLPAELTSTLGKAVADLNQLFLMAVEHRNLTLKRDKAELEAMEKGDSFSNNQYFAAVYTPVDPKTPPDRYIPPPAQVVAVTGKPHPDEKGETNVVPTKTRSGQTSDVPVQRLVILDKSELFESGRANVAGLYAKRVEAMQQKIKAIRMYSANLKDKLNAEASRSP